MSVASVVVLSFALVTVGVLAVMVVGLIRHMKLLVRSVSQFQREIQPILEEIQGGVTTAQERMERAQTRVQRIQEPDSGRNGGARLRR